MKYMKILGLAAVAAAALMAFVGASTASAAVLCSTTTTPCNSVVPNHTKIGFRLNEGAAAVLTNTAGEELDTCKKSTVTGELTNPGGESSSPTGPISTLDWEECTFTTTTVSGFSGKLEITGPVTGNSNGTIVSDAEIKVTITIPLFGSCVYGVKAGVSLGSLTEGNPPTFDPSAVAERLSGSSIPCPLTAFWRGENGGYQMFEPAPTTIAVEPK